MTPERIRELAARAAAETIMDGIEGGADALFALWREHTHVIAPQSLAMCERAIRAAIAEQAKEHAVEIASARAKARSEALVEAGRAVRILPQNADRADALRALDALPGAPPLRREVREADCSTVCEWNPDADRPGLTGDRYHDDASVLVGSDGAWRLCASCAGLPRFARFRVRRPIARRSV